MRRREFMTLLGGAAAWPLAAARAQQPGKVWRMGFIAHGHEKFYDALFEGLREYGYEEGRNLIVERRYARGQAERFQTEKADNPEKNDDPWPPSRSHEASMLPEGRFCTTKTHCGHEANF